jgi:transposase
MMWNGRRVTAYAYTAPVDMRKGFDGQMAVVEQKLGRDPLSGELFLFVSRNLIRAKVLFWDGTGLCVFAKRLEQGRFARLWNEQGETVRLTLSELQLFLEGSKLVGKISLSPPEMVDFSLANRTRP